MREDIQRSLQQIFYDQLATLEATVDEMEPLLEDFLGVIGVGADGDLQQVNMELQGQPQPGIRITGAIGDDEYQFTVTFAVDEDDNTITVHVVDGDDDDEDDFEIILEPALYTMLVENHLILGYGGEDHQVMDDAEDIDLDYIGEGAEAEIPVAVVVAPFNNHAVLGDGADDDDEMEGPAVDPDNAECANLQEFFCRSVIEAMQDAGAENTHIAQDFLEVVGGHNVILEIEGANIIRIRPVGDNNPRHDFAITVDDEGEYIGFALRYEGGGIEDAFEFHEEENDIGDALDILRDYTELPEYHINIDDDGAEDILDIQQPNILHQWNPGALVGAVGGSGFDFG